MKRFEIDSRFTWKKLIAPLATAGAFWALAIAAYVGSGQLFALINFGYLGTALGIGLSLYVLLRSTWPMPNRSIRVRCLWLANCVDSEKLSKLS